MCVYIHICTFICTDSHPSISSLERDIRGNCTRIGLNARLGQRLLPLKTRSRLMSRSQQILHRKLRYSLTNDGWKTIFLYKWYLFGWDVNSWGVVSKPIFFIVSLLKRPSFKFIFSKREDWVTDMFQVFKDPRVVFCWAPQITLLLLLGSIEVNDWSHAKKLGGLIQHFFIDGLGLGHENLNDCPLSLFFCCLGILTLKVFFVEDVCSPPFDVPIMGSLLQVAFLFQL